jgi:hypothetical protein
MNLKSYCFLQKRGNGVSSPDVFSRCVCLTAHLSTCPLFAALAQTLKFHARVWTVCAQLQHRLREWLTAPARSIDGARVFHECDHHWPNTLRELGTPA